MKFEPITPVAFMFPSDIGDFQFGEKTAEVYSIKTVSTETGETTEPLFTLEQLKEAYRRGWIATCEWCGELDMLADIDSPEYKEVRDRALLVEV